MTKNILYIWWPCKFIIMNFWEINEKWGRKSWSRWKDSKNDYFGGELVITYSNLFIYYEQDMAKSTIFLDYYNNVYQKWYENW